MKRLIDNRNVTNRQDLLDSVLIGLVLTTLSYAVGLYFRWETHLNWLEVFAVFTSYVSTYLCVKERRFNYPAGAVSTAAYTVLFLHSHLYASAVLNFYLTPTLVYGWVRWRKDRVTRPVQHVSLKWIPAYALVTVVGYVVAARISHALGGTMAWTDATILAGSILAQFLLDNKKLENWIVWAVVDVIATYEYFATHLYLVGFQYIFFLLNAFYGYYVWHRSMNDERIRIDDRYAPDHGALAANSVRSQSA
jgi:nicotinamide mononucleotide transporter